MTNMAGGAQAKAWFIKGGVFTTLKSEEATAIDQELNLVLTALHAQAVGSNQLVGHLTPSLVVGIDSS